MHVLFFLFLKQGDGAEKQKNLGESGKEERLFSFLFVSDWDPLSGCPGTWLTFEVPKKKRIESKETEP